MDTGWRAARNDLLLILDESPDVRNVFIVLCQILNLFKLPISRSIAESA
jgi:hypothetical protein